jgi:hypothetical protein
VHAGEYSAFVKRTDSNVLPGEKKFLMLTELKMIKKEIRSPVV